MFHARITCSSLFCFGHDHFPLQPKLPKSKELPRSIKSWTYECRETLSGRRRNVYFTPRTPLDGRNPAPPGMYKLCKQWNIYHISWLAGFLLPSTVELSGESSGLSFGVILTEMVMKHVRLCLVLQLVLLVFVMSLFGRFFGNKNQR